MKIDSEEEEGGDVQTLQLPPTIEPNTPISFIYKAEAALSTLKKKDFPEGSEFLPLRKDGLALVCEACMHLQAGIDADIEVDKRGRVKDTTWKGGMKMINYPEIFLQKLKEFKCEIDAGNVPPHNIEMAKRVAVNMGEDFCPAVLRKRSNLAGALCEWLQNIFLYYEACTESKTPET